jgi:hypothetical protein
MRANTRTDNFIDARGATFFLSSKVLPLAAERGLDAFGADFDT